MEIEMKRAWVFAILMQDIEGKSPDYLMEKWETVQGGDNPESILDPVNLAKFRAWQMGWAPQLLKRKMK